MSWSLVASKSPGVEPQSYQLRENSTTCIVLDDVHALEVVSELHPGAHTELGRITVGPWGAKLEAITVPLNVGSSHVPKEKYQLQPRAGEQSEILLLRSGDVISSSEATISLTCVWQPPSEVQVSSSAAEFGLKDHANGLDGVAETPEEETENEDLDNTVTAVQATQSKSQPQATPQLSHQRSVIVQETPTTARINGVTDYPNESGMEIDQPKLIENAPVVEPADPEPYSTARTGQSQNGTTPAMKVKEPQGNFLEVPGENDSELNDMPAEMNNDFTEELPSRRRQPKVVVKSNKRPSPAMDDPGSEAEAADRPVKRAKKAVPSDNDTQDSRLSNIVVETSPSIATAKKGRKQKSAAKDIEEQAETIPSRSQRSSQRSVSAPTAEPYSGDTPRVATSNSSITDKSQAVKFLKKQGGSFIESVKESFNVLCVRDGDLHKTSKVLQAIAAGIPIVTDKWLIDSARAGQFLSVDVYRPSAPKQEKEWKFKLNDVISQPQTPFDGYTIHFTTSAHALYKPFTEIEQVCKAAGAQKVTTKKKISKGDKVIVLAVEGEDKEAEKLMQDGITCYYRHLLPISIFRGNLDLDSEEFKIGVGADDEGASTPKDTRTRRGRKD